MSNIFFKAILFILLIFSFLDAEINTDKNIQDQLNSIKVEIEKLKYIQNENTQLKIIELENSIKKFEDKFINKESLDEKLERYNDIVSRQDERINNNFTVLEITVAFFGVLITVIVIIFTFKSERNARIEATKVVEKWIKDNQKEVLKPINSQAEKLSSEIQEQIDEFFKDAKEQLSKHDIKKELDKRDKELLSKVTNSIKNKHEENYTYNDWYSLYLEEFYKEGRVHKLKALEYIDKAIKMASVDYEDVKARIDKSILLGELDENILEIKEYDYILEKYKNSDNENIKEFIAMSLFNKSICIQSIDEKIVVYNELLDRFTNTTNNYILSVISNTLYNKGVNLAILNETDKSLDAYDNLIKNFYDSENSKSLRNVAKAIINRIELSIFHNKNIENDVKLFKKKFSNEKNNLLKVELLEIINNAKIKKQDTEIELWLENYIDVKFESWSFDELKSWAKTLENKEGRERIEKYISIFEKKLEKDKEK